MQSTDAEKARGDSTSPHDAQPAHETSKPSTDMTNVLKHIQELEGSNSELKKKLQEALDRNGKLSQKTREGMQSALDTLMKKWMDAVDTKDDRVKDEFKSGLERLVKNSAEDNGVWQMMVSASALHERQEHNLDKLRAENLELRTRVNGLYGEEGARVVGEKAKAETELSRGDVAAPLGTGNMWDEFARDIGAGGF